MSSIAIETLTPVSAPMPGPTLPVLSLSATETRTTDPVELEAYYANRRQTTRNILLIGAASVGWNISLQIVTPLMAVHLLDLGVLENIQGTIQSINFWAVSILVMLFGWMSDHTISRFGRRKPYLFIAAPFIIAVLAAFPFAVELKFVALLLAMQGIYLLFMDLKNSTFALVMIDCVPGRLLGRAMAMAAHPAHVG